MINNKTLKKSKTELSMEQQLINIASTRTNKEINGTVYATLSLEELCDIFGTNDKKRIYKEISKVSPKIISGSGIKKIDYTDGVLKFIFNEPSGLLDY